MPLHPDSKILIVGSGVFGLSTALWLARAGYRRVTVLDMQDTASTGYDPGAGVDSASADINKIIRFSYGKEIEYQRLASQAAEIWDEWNREFASDKEVPEVLRRGERKLWYKCGFLRMAAGSEFSDSEIQTLRNMELEGVRDTQFKSDDDADIQRAMRTGWAPKLDVCRRQERFGVHKAVLDSSAGFVVAFKACAWAQLLAKRAGVDFILHPTKGKVVGIEMSDDNSKHAIVRTADGISHEADLVVVAAGGWTAGLVPEADGLIETTAGSVATIRLPEDRKDLWERFSPENFPVVTWGMHEGKDIYSFPRDENGVIKIGYRKTKWTNFSNCGGKRISVPKTAHVTQEKETRIPVPALEGIKEYISTNLPELADLGLSSTWLCWYTDSIDNSFVVDYVPGRPRLAVCSGGSGHGFKFLPILGREVVKILEGKADKTVFGALWKWRSAAPGKARNGLEEGEDGPRVLERQQMAGPDDWIP
ncbi:FAD dependent oxidoreductase [Xylariaceae sp. FL0594]|nr:FAD dependent oxidoreductase [Xylariaceae sp. FL0594]